MYYFLTCSIISVGHFGLAISEVLVIFGKVFVCSFWSLWSFSWLTITITAYETLLNGLKQQQRTRHPSLQWIFALPSGNKNKQKNKNSAYNRPLPVSPKPRLRSEAKRADLLQVDLLASGASLYWPRSGRLLKVYQARSHWYKNDCLFSSK